MFTSQVLICSCSHSVLTLSSCSMFCLYMFSVNTDTHNRNQTVRKSYRLPPFLPITTAVVLNTLGQWFPKVSQECVSLKLVVCKDIFVFCLFICFATLYYRKGGLQIVYKLYSRDNANQRWRAWTSARVLGHWASLGLFCAEPARCAMEFSANFDMSSEGQVWTHAPAQMPAGLALWTYVVFLAGECYRACVRRSWDCLSALGGLGAIWISLFCVFKPAIRRAFLGEVPEEITRNLFNEDRRLSSPQRKVEVDDYQVASL